MEKAKAILALGDQASEHSISAIIQERARIEKLAIKDAKLRTFITQDESRDDLVSHVYDITYGCIVPQKDTIVIIDDSIVRGTTLKRSILRMLDRLNPKKIVIVPHRNPDGDAMGSTLGLYHFLLKLNHEVVVISPNEFSPASLNPKGEGMEL